MILLKGIFKYEETIHFCKWKKYSLHLLQKFIQFPPRQKAMKFSIISFLLDFFSISFFLSFFFYQLTRIYQILALQARGRQRSDEKRVESAQRKDFHIIFHVLENSDTFGEQVTAIGDAALELCTSYRMYPFKSTARDLLRICRANTCQVCPLRKPQCIISIQYRLSLLSLVAQSLIWLLHSSLHLTITRSLGL